MTANVSQEAAGTEQHSLAKILGIWAAAAVPMGILGWTVAPAQGRPALKLTSDCVLAIWRFNREKLQGARS